MAMLKSLARPLDLSSFHARLQAPRLLHNLRQIKVELYTPGALQAIIDAPTVAREHKQTKTRPESVMVSLLKQENGKAVKLLEEMGVNPWDMKLQLLAFLDRQPKTTGSRFTDAWETMAHYMYTFKFHNMAETMLGIQRTNPYFNKVRFPKAQLDSFLHEAKQCMIKSGSLKVGEEHLVEAYTKDIRYGKAMFGDLEVTGRFVCYAAKKL